MFIVAGIILTPKACSLEAKQPQALHNPVCATRPHRSLPAGTSALNASSSFSFSANAASVPLKASSLSSVLRSAARLARRAATDAECSALFSRKVFLYSVERDWTRRSAASSSSIFLEERGTVYHSFVACLMVAI